MNSDKAYFEYVPIASIWNVVHRTVSMKQKAAAIGHKRRRAPAAVLFFLEGQRHVNMKYFSQQVAASETDESDVSASEDDDTSWVTWFCSLQGNEFFCEVDEDYIQDEFNLSGLNLQVPYYDYALDLILDIDSPHEEMLTEEQHELVESAAEMLYGLIHQRFILTSRGLSAMYEKFKNVDFGRCPRVLCGGAPALPVGQADVPRTSTVKIFCPKCEDIYYPRSKLQGNIDGAYFGTTFPHLFLMTYNHIRPSKVPSKYTPKIFGFKIHPSSYEISNNRKKEKKGDKTNAQNSHASRDASNLKQLQGK